MSQQFLEFCKSLGNTTLQESSKTLHGPGHHRLEIMGKFEEILSYKGRYTSQGIFVIKGLQTNLLQGRRQHIKMGGWGRGAGVYVILRIDIYQTLKKWGITLSWNKYG